MLCLRCATENGSSARYCRQCSAILPRAVDDDAAQDTTLPHYRNDALERLDAAVVDYLEGEGELSLVEQAALVLESRLVRLLDKLPSTLASLAEEAPELAQEELFQRIQRLTQTGVEHFNLGLDALEQALGQEEDADFEEILENLFRGSDEICHAGTLLGQLVK